MKDCVPLGRDATGPESLAPLSATTTAQVLGNLGNHAAKRLDAGIPGAEPYHGMTAKQYDRYLHFRAVFNRVAARRLAMVED